jgi:hypothetical protein
MSRSNTDLASLASLLCRGYLRLLTTRPGEGLYLPTCLRDTTSEILDSPLDVGPGQRDEWCGGDPNRSAGCRTP